MVKKRYSKYITGTFHPRNKAKFKSNKPAEFRSGLERSYLIFCDTNPSVVSWSYESAIITYMDASRGNSVHRYIIDFVMDIKEKSGRVVRHYVEIKPDKFTRPPTKRGRMKEKTWRTLQEQWLRNASKWKAANSYAKKRGAKFTILTEKHLKAYMQKPSKKA